MISPPPPQQLSEVERAWAAVRDSTSIAVLEAFRRQYGVANPVYDRLAEARIEELRRQQVALLKAEDDKRRARGGEEAGRGGAEAGGGPCDAGPACFLDCDVCPEMVVVPAGSFMMGSPPGEADRELLDKGSESPLRWVTFARPFAVGKFEVTFAEWDACIAAGGCRHAARRSGLGPGHKRPVINVSWDDIAKEYLPWLSRKTGKAYRLLTEAEWEYAARAGTTTRTGRKANTFGLHDMHGNGWEWVQDCWNESYNGAPSDGSAWTTGDCSLRVHRGEFLGASPASLALGQPNKLSTDDRSDCSGFRLGNHF